MDEESPQEKISRLVRQIGKMLDPIMYPPRPDTPVMAPYAVIDSCNHVYLSDARSFLDSPDELVDLIEQNLDRQRRIVAMNPKRASEKAPGCTQCSIERGIRRRTEPLHWRLN
jgi:hypothetical protein